ncbi:multidrug ABC transporter ATP-binding protein [Candidatus Endobugula sertula]|uniref:Multidrug ABC transporter ATP-binding protein n=1 Tax=Candidatus Endobugula sertula TaxID=62101 RepID=A0A1D2QLL9_9GAMM|nr:multidrug ABC transporter ATP-binding protein [Candidatus Endobugula sertula]
MLQVNQLTRRYGDIKAVNNVSFLMKKGEIVGLLGHNGAGKTTIMKMVSGFLEPNQGSIHVDSIALIDEPKKVQLRLGYLPENLPVYPEMVVADYLDYAAALKGLKGDNKRAEIKRAVTETDISTKLLAPISTLSRGYKQRVGVAQAILGRPKLLILDEPTNGLDPEQTQHMRRLIRDIAKDATVILSTHIMQEVSALCSRVLILKSGQLAVDSTLDALRQSQYLIVNTSLPVKQSDNLKVINGVQSITLISDSQDDISFQYRIALQKNVNSNESSALLAKYIIDSGESLYQLHVEQRDLETLFREVNEGSYLQEEVSHAA